jgi:hypothetical protein
MPRASWKGHLRLSLVSCPVYLSPATARAKAIRLHQVWQASPAGDDAGEPPTQRREQDIADLRAPMLHSDDVEDRTEPVGPVSRITLRPHDPTTTGSGIFRGFTRARGIRLLRDIGAVPWASVGANRARQTDS